MTQHHVRIDLGLVAGEVGFQRVEFNLQRLDGPIAGNQSIENLLDAGVNLFRLNRR